MTDTDLLTRYNYDAFTPEKFGPWMNFEASAPLGEPAPDFPLWQPDGSETSLQALWSDYTYLIAEFGGFT